MKVKQMNQKKIINIISIVLIYGLSFIISLIAINSFLQIPNLTQPGLYEATILNYTVANYQVSYSDSGIDFTIIKEPIYDFLPFILSFIIFLLFMLIIYLIKRWVNKNWL